MTRLEILDELKKLSLSERLTIIESAIRLIRDDLEPAERRLDTSRQQLAAAAEILLADYTANTELTVFTALDGEDFHEKG